MLSVDPGAMTRMLDRLACKGWIERLPSPADKRGVLVQLTPDRRSPCGSVIRLWVRSYTRVNKKSVGGRSRRASNSQERSAVTIRRGKMMSRRNNERLSLSIVFCRGSRITWNRPCRWKKCLSAQVTPSGTCNVCLERDRPFSASTSASRKLTEIAQKLKQSNEPILYLAERYEVSDPQQTLTRTFKNYFRCSP